MEQPTALKNSGATIEYENAWKYGEYFYIVTLADGRDVGISVDKVLVTGTGDLLAMSSTLRDDRNETIPIEPKTILCLAKGQWLSFYAASALTGDPVGIDWIQGTES
jgi:hypothetical protein